MDYDIFPVQLIYLLLSWIVIGVAFASSARSPVKTIAPVPISTAATFASVQLSAQLSTNSLASSVVRSARATPSKASSSQLARFTKLAPAPAHHFGIFAPSHIALVSAPPLPSRGPPARLSC